MKQLVILCLLFCSLWTNAQTDTTEVQANSVQVKFIKLPESTAIGAPDGKSVSKEIGPAGGKIISDDRRMELIFPGGALSVNTAISIQPIVNLIPNGNGKGYRFEPSGIQFQKPVQVIFHYTDEEAEACPPELKFMALQDHNGKWEYMNYDDWDSVGKSLKGSISHFSQVIDGNLMELNPVESTLKVGETLDLFLNYVIPATEGVPGDFDLTMPARAPNEPNTTIKWFVKGGRRFGTVSLQTNKYQAIYQAPNYLPKSNTKVVLEISKTTIQRIVQKTRLRGKSLWTGETRVPKTTKFTFTSNITLYDEYQITILYNGPSTLRCGAELKDLSIFQARLYPNKVEIDDMLMINSEPTLTKPPNCKSESRGGRKADYTLTYDPEGCQGPVHVSSNMLAGYGMLSNDQATEPPDITIEFVPTEVKIMNEQTHYPPTPGGSTNKFFLNRQKIIPPGKAKDEPPEALEDENVGNKIQFKANRKGQEYDRAGDMPKRSFKLIIEPL